MTPDRLVTLLKSHLMYLDKTPGGVRAIARDLDLAGITLNNVRLAEAALVGANFNRAVLNKADFSAADLLPQTSRMRSWSPRVSSGLIFAVQNSATHDCATPTFPKPTCVRVN